MFPFMCKREKFAHAWHTWKGYIRKSLNSDAAEVGCWLGHAHSGLPFLYFTTCHVLSARTGISTQITDFKVCTLSITPQLPCYVNFEAELCKNSQIILGYDQAKDLSNSEYIYLINAVWVVSLLNVKGKSGSTKLSI